MRCILLIAVALVARAQPAPDAAAKLHADVLRLVEVSGAKVALQANMKQFLEQGRARMMEACTGCDPAFAAEWAKRMAERIRIDDFLAIFERIYEKYLTDSEVLELIDLQTKARTTPSDALKEKMTAQMSTIQSEIMGATTQYGSKLGGDVGMEIQKEHPEYFKDAAASSKPLAQ